MRLALIDILLALAPIALGLWILPHTAGWGRHWLRLFMTTVFQQAVQLIALALGFGFLKEFAAIAAFEPVQDLVWKLLMSLAFIYMATRVPSMMGNAGTFDSWLSMLYFGMNPARLDGAVRQDHRADRGREPPEGREALRWGRWRPARGLSAAASGLSSAASMATPSGWRRRRRRERPPGAAASSPQRTATQRARPGPMNKAKEVGAMCS